MKQKPAALCLVVTLSLHSVAAALPDGRYITALGWGKLKLGQSHGRQQFDIYSAGPNGQTCSLTGEVKEGRAVLTDSVDASQCTVTFAQQAGGIEIGSLPGQSCQPHFCGTKGNFEGLYLKPEAGCEDIERARTHHGFKQQFERKAYAEARDMLAPLLARCQATLDPMEAAWTRNDLAITQYKLGDRFACQRLLAPLADEAGMSDETLRAHFPPAEAVSHLALAQATRTNLKLCNGLED